MKRIFIISIFALLTTVCVFGQSSKTKKADNYFEKLSYVKAAASYKVALKKDSTAYVLQRLGDCYYLNANMEQASEWYALLFNQFETDSIQPEYLFKYGQALRGNGNYKESDQWIEKFSKRRKEDVRGKNFTESNLKIEDLTSKEYVFQVNNLTSINTERSDFGAMFYKEGIVYASARPQSKLIKRRHSWNNRGFLDLYFVTLKGSVASDKQAIEEVNTIYHESSVSFSPDGKTLYFTRNNAEKKKLKKDQKGISNLKLYKAEWVENTWQNVTELPFNNDEYSVGHPAVSSDGKRLYFVSDMPGTIGQTDIFFVRIKEDGSYGPIETLGGDVNTEGREMFPYVYENELYFSSDGHFGLGGLDVFVSTLENDEFQEVKNMGTPINSQSDDFAFVIDKKKKLGYVSSNRKDGIGDDDIYAFTYEENQIAVKKETPCKQEISGVVVDKKFGLPLSNTKIQLIKISDGFLVSELITGASGKFSYQLPCNEQYKITASKEYYKPDSNTFKTTETLSLELDLDFDLGVIDAFEYNDRDELMIRIDPIFFDYNKSTIRSDAAIQLDKIVASMSRFPKLIVESTSHTDARGKARYNEILSDKRAKSTVRYIVSKGIDEDRISGNGYGETRLTNGCIDNDSHSNRVTCSKEEHQANRRSEFIITNVAALGIATKIVQKTEVIQPKKETKSQVKLHIVKQGETLYSISKLYGLTIQQLKNLNGLSDTNIAVGQRLEVKQ